MLFSCSCSFCVKVAKRLGLPLDNINENSLDARLEDILDKNGRDLEDIYNFVRQNITYKRIEKASDEEMVIYALNYRRGACYHYAALSHFLLKAAGYEVQTIKGAGLDVNGDGIPDADEHYWNLVMVDGKWLHFDALQGQFLKNDEEMKKLGYNWED